MVNSKNEGNIEDLLIVKDKDRKIDELKQEIDEKNKKLRDHDEFSKSQIKDLTSKVNSLSQEKRNLEKNNGYSLDKYDNKKSSDFIGGLLHSFWSDKSFRTLFWIAITITAGRIIFNPSSFNPEKTKFSHSPDVVYSASTTLQTNKGNNDIMNNTSQSNVYKESTKNIMDNDSIIREEYLSYKQELRKYSPRNPETTIFTTKLLSKANSLKLKNNLDYALLYYDLVLKLEPKNISVYLDKIDVLRKMGRSDVALGEVGGAMWRTGKSRPFYDVKASILEDLGRYEEAKMYRK